MKTLLIIALFFSFNSSLWSNPTKADVPEFKKELKKQGWDIKTFKFKDIIS